MGMALAYFESRAEHYEEQNKKGLWNYFRTKEYRSVIELLAPAPGSSLLEYGCGSGYYTIRLARQFFLKILALDSSPAMLSALRLLIGNEKIEPVFIDIQTFETDRVFDAALAAGVLEFVENPEEVFSSCAKALRPGSKFVILVPTPGLGGAFYRQVHTLQGCPTYLRKIHEYDLLGTALGFQLERVQKPTTFSMVLQFVKT